MKSLITLRTNLAVIPVLLFAVFLPFSASAQAAGSAGMVVMPLNSDGTTVAGSAATWQSGEEAYVLVGDLPNPAGSFNPLIAVYLSNPSGVGSSTLILETVPTTSATATYAIDPGLLASVPPGSYALSLSYSVDDPTPETYAATSSALVTLSAPASQNPPSSQCASGFVYSAEEGMCVVYDPYGDNLYGSSGSGNPTVTLPPGESASAAPTNAPTDAVASGPSGLVICTGAKDSANPQDTRPICNFTYLFQEAQHIINWLFAIAIPVAAVLFAYGGILYIIASPEKRTRANKIFTATGIGFGVMLVAWAAVYTIVSWLTGAPAGSFITAFIGT